MMRLLLKVNLFTCQWPLNTIMVEWNRIHWWYPRLIQWMDHSRVSPQYLTIPTIQASCVSVVCCVAWPRTKRMKACLFTRIYLVQHARREARLLLYNAIQPCSMHDHNPRDDHALHARSTLFPLFRGLDDLDEATGAVEWNAKGIT